MLKPIFLNINLFIETLKVLFSLDSQKSNIFKEKKIIIDGSPLAYFKEGEKGLPVILLHGWGQSKETWIKIIKNLEKKYIVYALDLPGFGKTPLIKNVLTINDYEKIIEEFININKIKKPILLGHSFGGKIALEFAIKQKNKINKLILYSSSAFPKKGILNSTISLGIKILRSKFLVLPIMLYLIVRKKEYKKFKILLEIYKKQKTKSFNKENTKIKIKTLLIYGKYDTICSSFYGKELNKIIPNSKLFIFEKSSHLAHLEEEKKFIKEITRFME